ncbi:uncharacterized protein A1O9_09792 [Exophiala aquamarina CBS 119918]|uniref:Uncharacterized protein n=1 Tax=Exophiala aquamarina CBS 119918 TaxID=1182545 RepID=A0A072P2S1_9EURO|nr:uncharacterized protein A1O9_09792 [Exophiala aquamarina CBS 119918]KEF53997.1 hypothetical protein A1O9_09792 [Exophiala aquamarina CBS 119918]
MVDAQAARSRFLQASGHALCLSSPSTSRHLMTESSQLTHWAEASPDSCTACGSLFLPGWTMSFGLASTNQKSESKAKSPEKQAQEKTRRLKCGVCHRVTKATMSYPIKTRRQNIIQSGKSPKAQLVAGPEPGLVNGKSSKPLSSKQRAKARRDRDGLQSSLNRNAQNRMAPALNLMDLMKK